MKRKSHGFPTTMRYNESESDDDLVISNLFADFFASNYAKNDLPYATYPYNIDSYLISDPIINESVVRDNMMSLKPCFSAGPDNIPSFILKRFCDILSVPVTYLFNLSFNLGVFPKLWKSSYVIPFHKSGSKVDIKNYRCISRLSALPKLFEQVLTSQLAFNLQNIISPNQHGFMRGKSTTTNLLQFVSCVVDGFASGLCTDTIYLDCEKAFDRVCQVLLLFKCDKIGLSPKMCKWLSSYLKNRTQRVLFKQSLSQEINVCSGVPQGSHLGPLLFLIYLNDLPTVIKKCNILLFADDVKLFYTYSDNHEPLQNDLDNVVEWCRINEMNLNLSKCKSMSFSRVAVRNVEYKIGDYTLESVSSFVDLGVTMDPKLKFNLHVTKIVSKATCTLGFIKRWAKEFKDPYATKALFTGAVRPILEYASVVWCPRYQTYSNAIESVQKQFLLFCLRRFDWNPNLPLPSYLSRLKLIDLPPLFARRTMLNISFVHNILNGTTTSQFLLDRIAINVPFRESRNYRFFYLEYFRYNYLNDDPFRSALLDFNVFYNQIDFSVPVYKLKRNILSVLS